MVSKKMFFAFFFLPFFSSFFFRFVFLSSFFFSFLLNINKLFFPLTLPLTDENGLEKRIGFINAHFMYALYCNICRSLLEKDKLLFSFSLTTRLMQAHHKIPKSEFYFLLTGGVAVDNPYTNPSKEWISEKMWGEICRVTECSSVFTGLKESVMENHITWKELYDSSNAHTHVLPFQW